MHLITFRVTQDKQRNSKLTILNDNYFHDFCPNTLKNIFLKMILSVRQFTAPFSSRYQVIFDFVICL